MSERKNQNNVDNYSFIEKINFFENLSFQNMNDNNQELIYKKYFKKNNLITNIDNKNYEKLQTDNYIQSKFNKIINEINNNENENDNIKFEIPIKQTQFICNYCNVIFIEEDNYQQHIMIHSNQNENKICVCKNCNQIFEDDINYSDHIPFCLNNEYINNDIPSDPYGKYICPSCGNKYSNSYLLGEHFIINHNDYDILTTLDTYDHKGFPGFDILENIGMIKFIKKIHINIPKKKCKICFFNFTNNNYNHDEIIDDNRNPLLLKCCKKLICYDCLMNHIIFTNSIICPFCLKDHTRIDLTYIIYIEPSYDINKEKWVDWWDNHIDIFIKD